MINPPRITWQDMDPSPAIEADIRKRVASLDRYFDRIVSCAVTVQRPHRRQRKGQHIDVRIDLTVPGREIAVAREPGDDDAHFDPHVAVRDAFDAARRRLQDHAHKIRGDLRYTEPGPTGVVSALLPDGDHGFLRTAEGREIYFHRSSVQDGSFEELAVGTPVDFVEAEGDKGPQASVVHPHSASM